MGADEKAEPIYQEALRIIKAALGEEHPCATILATSRVCTWLWVPCDIKVDVKVGRTVVLKIDLKVHVKVDLKVDLKGRF